MSQIDFKPSFYHTKPLDARPANHPAHTKPWLKATKIPILYTNALVVDPENSCLLDEGKPQDILIENGKIASVARSGSQESFSGEKIDLKERYVCPGLIDTHVHVTAVPGPLTMSDLTRCPDQVLTLRSSFVLKDMLQRGFTTVRDCGGATKHLAVAISEGLIEGPRLFQVGKALSQTGGHGDFVPGSSGGDDLCCGGHSVSLGRTCDGVPQCLKAVREEIKAGADQIKVMCGGGVASEADAIDHVQFTEEEIRAITTVAKNLGNVHVTAHAYTVKAIMQAINNGVMGIEHGNLMDESTAREMAKRGIFYTPTLSVLHVLNRPPFCTSMTEEQILKSHEVMEKGLEAIKMAYEAGVIMCYGSDMLMAMHPYQNEEFAILSHLVPSEHILKMATTNAAKLLRQEGKIGVIRPGAHADMVVLSQNPLEDISILDRHEEYLKGVMKGGQWKKPLSD